MKRSHSMPFGAECREDGSVRFRLWAPEAQRVDLLLCRGTTPSIIPLTRDDDWFELITTEAMPGMEYLFQIDSQLKVPDPASRFQPRDVAGPSEVIDPRTFEWKDDKWWGRPWPEAIIYELHVGTFTPEGTFAGVKQRLDYLADLGITAIELMPVSDFPGKRNWGYDGTLPYAPDSSYGSAEDLKELIASAHERRLMVFLDVVYNHFGPEGNHLHSYAPQFFTDRHRTPWGDAINVDGPKSQVVRQYLVHNALYWLEEYHFDGLRLDAVHSILDDSDPDFLTELAETVRRQLGHERFVHLILENYNNAAHYLKRDEWGEVRWYSAQWNDDIHHSSHVLITGETDGYYADYSQEPIHKLGHCLTEGFAYQGEISPSHVSHGEISRGLPLTAFISFLQNHDQIGNRAFGERILSIANVNAVRAVTEILLLAPSVPLLFMGEEFGAQTPFLFFCDFDGDLAVKVTEGRRTEFATFPQFGSPEKRTRIPDPNSEQTFMKSKLKWESVKDRQSREWLQFYRDLLLLRRQFVVPHLRSGPSCRHASFRTFGDGGLIVEWFLGDRSFSLIANLAAKSTALPHSYGGQMIYASSPGLTNAFAQSTEQVEFPPWSVAWFLQS